MRSLNIEELPEVQGGGLALKWAERLGTAIANSLAVIDAASRIDTVALINDSTVNHDNTNPMGDHTQEN